MKVRRTALILALLGGTIANAHTVSLRARGNQYLRLAAGAAQTIDFKGVRQTGNSVFQLVDHNGEELMPNDVVSLRATNGSYVRLENGVLVAKSQQIGEKERFTVVANLNRAIFSLDNVSLRAANGKFVTAVGGGGGGATVNSVDNGANQQFVLTWGPGSVTASYDGTRMRQISVDGRNLLTGGGVYLIGSFDGDDVPQTNCESINSKNGRMTNGGPRFKLQFRPTKSESVFYFKAEVGPITAEMRQLSLAFDFQKGLIKRWEFEGTHYKYELEDPVEGNKGFYADIPTPHTIRDINKRVLGKAGIVTFQGKPNVFSIRGPNHIVRFQIANQFGLKNVVGTNHFATNNIGLGLHRPTIGQTVSVEGYFAVEAK